MSGLSAQSPVRIAAVIPARMASSRFPGKPLLQIKGLPMVEHVRRRVLLSGCFKDVIVATCDREIASVVASFGGRYLMTSASHPGALDRVAEAAAQLDCTHVVNIQGDEILVLPADIAHVARAILREPAVWAWNAAARIERAEEFADRSIVKLIVSKSDRVLFCLRDFSCFPFKGMSSDPIRKSIGVMGYHRSFLERYLTMERTPLETAESIDQLRIIEHDVTLRVVDCSHAYPAINEPREVKLVEHCLDENPTQQVVLREILSS